MESVGSEDGDPESGGRLGRKLPNPLPAGLPVQLLDCTFRRPAARLSGPTDSADGG